MLWGGVGCYRVPWGEGMPWDSIGVMWGAVRFQWGDVGLWGAVGFHGVRGCQGIPMG